MSQFELHFELEPNCLLNCKHCSSNSIKGESRKYEIDDIVRLIKAINSPCEMYFTGGEPLLFEGLCSAFYKISSQVSDCKIGLFTSGIINSSNSLRPIGVDYLSELYRAGLRICYVSLYSNEDNWHDYMTNTIGSHYSTVQAIQNMAEAGVDARINLVVSKFNYTHILDIIKYADSLGASEVRLLKLIPHGSAVRYWDKIGISDSDYLQAVQTIHALSAQLPIKVTFSSLPQLSPCRPLANSVGCQARKRLFYVTLDGNIYPCACVKNDKSFSICNLQDPNLEYYINGNYSPKLCFSNCIADRRHLTMELEERFSSVFTDCFGAMQRIDMRNNDIFRTFIQSYIHDCHQFYDADCFFEYLLEKNKTSCLSCEIHSFFIVKSQDKNVLNCFVVPGSDMNEVYQTTRIKFPSSHIVYQVVDSVYFDRYIRQLLFEKLISSFDFLSFGPEVYKFVLDCLDL